MKIAQLIEYGERLLALSDTGQVFMLMDGEAAILKRGHKDKGISTPPGRWTQYWLEMPKLDVLAPTFRPNWDGISEDDCEPNFFQRFNQKPKTADVF